MTEARARDWDVILAGSSFASMFFLHGLPKDLSVLIVEKGPILPYETRIQTDDVRPDPVAQTNHGTQDKLWIANAVFGGNSNCWWGQTPRFHPDDFRTRTLYGIARDWPISYDTLEPFYDRVERIMDISGGGSDHILPRSRPFPFPPHAPSRSDTALRADDPLWVPVMTARSAGGSRASCCATGACHRCPVDARFTILNGMRHFERPGVSLLLETEVHALRIEAGTARAALVRGAEGTHEIRGSLIGLGANAIFNAAILLRSGFTAQALGRYLHEQASVKLSVDLPMQNFFGGTSITGLGYHFYHDFDRTDQAAVLMENFNVPAKLRPEKDRWTERLTLKLIAEDTPQARNRVVLDGDVPRIDWHGHADHAEAGLAHARAHLADALPVAIEAVEVQSISTTEAHIQGTTRMGGSIEEGVVDATLKTHEARNVLALGAGVFPSCSPANPTLTLSALSLYAASAL